MSHEHDALAPAPIEADYRGETLQITPITVGELPAFARAAATAAPALLALARAAESDAQALVLGMELLELHGDAVTQLVALGVRKRVEWVRGATRPEEVLTLLGVVMRANDDFFRRHLALARARQLDPAAGDGAGRTPASTSSLPAMH